MKILVSAKHSFIHEIKRFYNSGTWSSIVAAAAVVVVVAVVAVVCSSATF
jgi:hypothetical protein